MKCEQSSISDDFGRTLPVCLVRCTADGLRTDHRRTYSHGERSVGPTDRVLRISQRIGNGEGRAQTFVENGPQTRKLGRSAVERDDAELSRSVEAEYHWPEISCRAAKRANERRAVRRAMKIQNRKENNDGPGLPSTVPIFRNCPITSDDTECPRKVDRRDDGAFRSMASASERTTMSDRFHGPRKRRTSVSDEIF